MSASTREFNLPCPPLSIRDNLVLHTLMNIHIYKGEIDLNRTNISLSCHRTYRPISATFDKQAS